MQNFLIDLEAYFQKTVILKSFVNIISFSFFFFYGAFYASGLQMMKESLHVERFSLMFSDSIYTSVT